ncbi:uncharacterized protein F5891DRAFT_1189795 [Suillus fuscotomentosus]|uniref:Uncharacterized protein n=1 Tax=Suillus fuscotomentosus TaxID=1912939 RepID=A0AAD4HK12_9AGAM|nr:uncharacterized protein F5891DRAFT_1189795 [Suillus fuscotomentosus]KAG1899352.1 hypothetical protein F5891DRAFT_1189795 [Suillus fuscotomentosus]
MSVIEAVGMPHDDIYRPQPVVVMPCNPRPGLDDGEDFEAEINAIMSDESDSSDGSDSEQSGSDLDQLRLVLAVSGADAQMHEVRKALAMAQQAYNTTQSELHVLKRQYLALSSAVPARSRNCVLKKTSPLDSSISHQGQRYVLYCHFWVINDLFPTTPQPGVDSCSTTHWTSPEAKLKGAMAELYLFILKDLHHSMETYSQFASLLREVKYPAQHQGLCRHHLLFFQARSESFCQPAFEEAKCQRPPCLIEEKWQGRLHPSTPVLFTKPNAMAADDFLKSIVLIKIVRVEVFGKAILGGKTWGHPKGRGLRMGTQSVSEGMIAGAAILASLPHIPYLVLLIVRSQAHFLLTHDAELTAIGAETKIDYQKDYNFYLEHLLKGMPWAISVMEYFNKEVFNTTTTHSTPISTTLPAATPRTWEDDFLQELDNLDPVIRHPSPARSLAHARAPSPTLSALSNLSSSIPAAPAVIHDDLSISAAMNFTSSTQVSIGQTGVTSASTQVHFDLNQLSLANNDIGSLAAVPAPLATGSKVPTRRGCISAQAAQVTMAADKMLTEPAKTKH